LVAEQVEFALRGSNVSCEQTFDDNLHAVEMDEGQMTQVVSNLIINALQAMPSGGHITVHAGNALLRDGSPIPLPPGDYVHLTVTDTGIGISQEHQKKIFDPYFTTKQRGSGLGLASAYSIIRNHDGIMSVDSIVDRGTTFHIWLPATTEAIDLGEPALGALRRGGGRILIMDDEEQFRAATSRVLERLGYSVDAAPDGGAALDLYLDARESTEPYDVVIMDLTVPGGMGGLELIGELRKVDPDVRAIVASGYSSDPVLSDISRYGFQDQVVKPFDVRELTETIERVLEDGGR
jgi:CheY-like chemotaxis protein